MKRYDIRVRYSFEGTYTVAAEDRDEAKRMVNDDCGPVVGGDILAGKRRKRKFTVRSR